MDEKPHMVKQTITYSDGSETVINYRGVIVDGTLIEDNPVEEEIIKEIKASVQEPVIEEEPEEVVEEEVV